MTKLFKIAIVSLAVLGGASSAQAVSGHFSVDTLIADQTYNGN